MRGIIVSNNSNKKNKESYKIGLSMFIGMGMKQDLLFENTDLLTAIGIDFE